MLADADRSVSAVRSTQGMTSPLPGQPKLLRTFPPSLHHQRAVDNQCVLRSLRSVRARRDPSVPHLRGVMTVIPTVGSRGSGIER
ncbi:hypothetical protein AOLI_G00037380 [Acnodon oligacanthus]